MDFNDNNIKKNLIDLLKIKTSIIYKYFKKINDVYYDYNSAKEISEVKIIKNNTYDIVTMICNNGFRQTYYITTSILKDFIPSDEYTYPEWIIYSYSDSINKDVQIKISNYYSLSFLSIHYSTSLEANSLRIYLLDHQKYSCYNKLLSSSDIKIVPNISDETKEFNLFYHPNYYNEYNIYGYKYTTNVPMLFKNSDYRIRKVQIPNK